MKSYSMPRSSVERIVRSFSKRKIMVIGDVMLDKYMWGDVQRISPEAPVPVVLVNRETLRFGGAANVARNLRTLGAKPFLLSIRGDDEHGRQLCSMLDESGCSTEGIVTSLKRPTTVKTRVMARHQQIVRIDSEIGLDLDETERKALWRRFEKWLPEMDAVIISDYAKGVVSIPFIGDVIAQCKKAGVFVAIDPKVRHFQHYRGVDVITPNLAETHAALGLAVSQRTDEEIRQMGWQLLDMLELNNLLITLSERGMALFERRGREFTHMPTMARAVFDVTGAGDTVISVFTAAISSKALPPDAAFIANHAAGLTVAEVGTSAVTSSQLVKACCGVEK